MRQLQLWHSKHCKLSGVLYTLFWIDIIKIMRLMSSWAPGILAMRKTENYQGWGLLAIILSRNNQNEATLKVWNIAKEQGQIPIIWIQLFWMVIINSMPLLQPWQWANTANDQGSSTHYFEWIWFKSQSPCNLDNIGVINSIPPPPAALLAYNDIVNLIQETSQQTIA